MEFIIFNLRMLVLIFTTQYVVPINIDSTFSIDELLQIKQALSNWEAVSHNCLHFKMQIINTDYDEYVFNKDKKITIYSGKNKWHMLVVKNIQNGPCEKLDECLAITMWESNKNFADIIIISHDIKYLQVITEHELGHVFGLNHSINKKSIMYPTTVSNKTISEYDKQALFCLFKTKTFRNKNNYCLR
jgi:hypothetical protein